MWYKVKVALGVGFTPCKKNLYKIIRWRSKSEPIARIVQVNCSLQLPVFKRFCYLTLLLKIPLNGSISFGREFQRLKTECFSLKRTYFNSQMIDSIVNMKYRKCIFVSAFSFKKPSRIYRCGFRRRTHTQQVL